MWADAEEHLGIAEWAAHTPGEGRTAICHGELAAETAVHDLVGVAIAHILIGRGHLDGDRPSPKAAAQAGLVSFDTVAAVPNETITTRVRQLHQQLVPLQLEGLVAELGRQVVAV
ncbi:hypothetical protein [Frankia sp. AgB32]|uniref:hypothetical protein n=1 Tax=Frankia sp. AgB32 TaxID=631119 RepID=UPI00200C78D8|nr:hypothetical protein [Frankia sp. AgB32]MCK9895635.1 hypothetical protein [Frankia sp. AgB32]